LRQAHATVDVALTTRSTNMRRLALACFLSLAAACAAEAPTRDVTTSLEDDVTTGDDKADGRSIALGATVGATSVAFRVWAPNASQVFVAGDFNQQSETANPLRALGDGTFAGHVRGALAGQRYQYVIHHGADVLRKADPRALAMDGDASGMSVIYDQKQYHWKSGSFVPPKFNEQVIYELHIGTFNDTDGPGTGTWASATDKLDYLAQLGVNMLEVLPPTEFSGDYSWGYNPSFPFAPEATYGSPDDMKAFVDAAHARGMGVIVDIVENHWGPDLPSLWCFDGECYGAGGEYFYTDNRRETGFGPRPDYGRSEVRDYIVDNAMMWLGDYHADGLRWDSTVNIRQASGQDLADGWGLLMRANDAADTKKIMIAEDLQNNDWVTKPTSQGGAGFDSQWDPDFYWPLRGVLTAGTDSQRDMNTVRYAVTHGYNGAASQRVIFTENHDEVAPQNGAEKRRMPEQIWPGHGDSYYAKKRSTLGAAVALTAPGVPMLFMGQEFLETRGFPFSKSQALDWSNADTNAGIWQLYSDLVHLRRNTDGHSRGLEGNSVNVFHVNNDAKVIAFHRWDQGGAGDDVVVIANFSNQAFPSYTVGLPRGGSWKVRFNSDWNGYSPDFQNTASNDTWADGNARDGLNYSASVGLGPYSVVILSQ
jgi:1,4-alpha-glucan branching enzyme